MTVAFALLILGKYFYVMVLKNDSGNIDPAIEINRGPILDRNGNVLAIQTNLYQVSAMKKELNKIKDTPAYDSTVAGLAEALDMKEDEIRELFKKDGFISIKRKISSVEADRVNALIDEEKIQKIRVDKDSGRNYPCKELASHLIGYVGADGVGKDGIECTMDRYLSPRDSRDIISGSVYGGQVFLTIDKNIQGFAQLVSQDIADTYRPEGIITIVADARTGEILAYVSMPEYDLNKSSQYAPDDPVRFNKPAMYTYEPGSVFKVFSLSSFMHIPGGITPDSTFFCSGRNCYTKKLDNKGVFHINCTGNHGRVRTADIIKYSCNTTCYASDTVSDEAFYDMIKLFRFGETTGIEVPMEESGSIKSLRSWTEYSKPHMAIGQELSVTAMQIIRAATAIANHGVMLSPHLVKKVTDAKGLVIMEKGREEICEVVSPKVADDMLLMMETATEHGHGNVRGGTARNVNVKGVRLSMKTGTAQVYDSKEHAYSHDNVTASAIAIFPTEDPKYIIYNVVFNPKPTEIIANPTGAGVSVPAVGKIANSIISYAGIPRDGETHLDFDGQINIDAKTFAADDLMPDFTGASKKHLLPLFEDGRFNVKIKGEGWVVRQSPAPGTQLEEGMILSFELK